MENCCNAGRWSEEGSIVSKAGQAEQRRAVSSNEGGKRHSAAIPILAAVKSPHFRTLSGNT